LTNDRAGMWCQNLEDVFVLSFRLDKHHAALPLNLNRLTGFDHLIEDAVDVLAKVRGGNALSHASKRTTHVVRTSTSAEAVDPTPLTGPLRPQGRSVADAPRPDPLDSRLRPSPVEHVDGIVVLCRRRCGEVDVDRRE